MILQTSKWLKYAHSDLRAAKHMYSDIYPKELEISCYHCQQCAEKAVKALIIYYGFGDTMPKVHDITFLLDQIKNKTNIDDNLYKKAEILSDYATSSRYPDEMVSDESQTIQAIKYAEEIYNWAKAIVKEEN